MVIGSWRVNAADGFEDLHRDDVLTFDGDNLNIRRQNAKFGPVEEDESYEINDRKIHLLSSRLVMRYSIAGDRMTMRLDDGLASSKLVLSKVEMTE